MDNQENQENQENEDMEEEEEEEEADASGSPRSLPKKQGEEEELLGFQLEGDMIEVTENSIRAINNYAESVGRGSDPSSVYKMLADLIIQGKGKSPPKPDRE